MATPEYQRLLPYSEAIAAEYELGPEDEMVLGSGALAFLEHIIHEVAHAASLDLLPYEKGTDDVIGNLLGKADDAGVSEEERTWAIEWFCWMTFGLDEVLVWGDLEAAAEIQGCDSAEIQRLVDPENEASDEIWALHEKTVAEVRRLTAEEASVRGATA